MKIGGKDLISDGWTRKEVGIWYGAWSAGDFQDALSKADPAAELSAVAGQKELGWGVSDSFVNTARRFAAISVSDWVFA
jgi:hypothetical protein